MPTTYFQWFPKTYSEKDRNKNDKMLTTVECKWRAHRCSFCPVFCFSVAFKLWKTKSWKYARFSYDTQQTSLKSQYFLWHRCFSHLSSQPIGWASVLPSLHSRSQADRASRVWPMAGLSYVLQKFHAHLEPQNVTIFGNRGFADITS